MTKEQQFIILIQENEGVIHKITSLYADSREDQKDLFQEVVVQLWTALDRFKNESKVSTWIYRIALNTAITRLRKVKKQVDNEALDLVMFNYAEPENQELDHKINALHASIAKLNELDKAIILLVLEDKSYEEISQIIGISVSNVGTRLMRIKQKLKEKMTTSYGT